MPNYFIKVVPNADKNTTENWRAVTRMADYINSLDTTVNNKTTGLIVSGNKVGVSSSDAIADYLNIKLIAGTGITLTKSKTGGAGGEIFTIAGHVPVTLATNHGLSLTGQVLAMGTPGTLTDATTNSVTTTTHTHAVTFPVAGGAEPALGDPAVDDYVLSSKMDGTRSWVAQSGGSSFDTDFSIKMSGVKSLANTTTTKIDTFDTIVIDTNTEWVAGDLQWVCKTTGTYIICACLAYDVSSVGYRNIYIYVDGAAVQARSYNNAGAANTFASITSKCAITSGQYVEIYGRQNSGGALNAIVATPAVEWQIWRIR